MEEGREKSPVRGKPDSVKGKKVNAKDLDRDTLDGDSPDGPSGKRTCLPMQETDGGSVPGSGRSPGGGLGNPLQYSCLENPMERGAWWATVHEGAKSQM